MSETASPEQSAASAKSVHVTSGSSTITDPDLNPPCHGRLPDFSDAHGYVASISPR